MTNENDSENVTPSPVEELAYIEGRAVAHRHAMLYHARELGIFHADDPSVALAYKTDELARVRRQLREISDRLGCNDWEDSLDLGDVVEKHVARAVDALLDTARDEPKRIKCNTCRAEMWDSDPSRPNCGDNQEDCGET